jgi:hypothetical protein
VRIIQWFPIFGTWHELRLKTGGHGCLKKFAMMLTIVAENTVLQVWKTKLANQWL